MWRFSVGGFRLTFLLGAPDRIVRIEVAAHLPFVFPKKARRQPVLRQDADRANSAKSLGLSRW
jgi:hypothetical protein